MIGSWIDGKQSESFQLYRQVPHGSFKIFFYSDSIYGFKGYDVGFKKVKNIGNATLVFL